jgi:hypothetical protein
MRPHAQPYVPLAEELFEAEGRIDQSVRTNLDIRRDDSGEPIPRNPRAGYEREKIRRVDESNSHFG